MTEKEATFILEQAIRGYGEEDGVVCGYITSFGPLLTVIHKDEVEDAVEQFGLIKFDDKFDAPEWLVNFEDEERKLALFAEESEILFKKKVSDVLVSVNNGDCSGVVELLEILL